MSKRVSSGVRRLVSGLVALMMLLAYVPFNPTPAYAASGTYSGPGVDGVVPVYVSGGHTVYAVHYSVAGVPAGYGNGHASMKIQLASGYTGGGFGNSASGATWNPGNRFVWNREGSPVSTPVDVSTGSASGWVMFKCANENIPGWTIGGLPNRAYLVLSLQPGNATGSGTGNTLNPDSPSPIVTLLPESTQSAWVHSPSGNGSAATFVTAANVSGGAVLATQFTEPNGCDDDENGVIDDEGAAGAFRLAVPPSTSMNVSIGGTAWSGGQGVSSGLADTDIAIGAADQTPPSAPSGLAATPLNNGVALSWTASTDGGGSGLAAYAVYRMTGTQYTAGGTSYTNSTALPVRVGTVGSSATSFTDATAVNGTSYTYFVRAIDSDTNVSARSNQVAGLPGQFQLHYAAGAGGTLTGTVSQTVSSGGSGTQVTAVPGVGKVFGSWSDGVLTAARTDANVRGNIDVTANFVPASRTLDYSAGTGGSINGTAHQTVQYGGSGTQVSAAPDAGYRFTGWSDGVATAARTDSNVTVDTAVTAQFASLDLPSTTISGLADGWSKTAETFTLTSTGSGDLVKHYTLNGGADTIYSAPVTVDAEGTTSIEYWATDSFGQTEVAKTATAKVDSVAPASTLTGVTDGGTLIGSVTLTEAAQDLTSGVAHSLYSIDGGAEQTYAAPFTVSGLGAHTVTYWSVDNAGNIEAQHSVSFTLASDTSAPFWVSPGYFTAFDNHLTSQLSVDMGWKGAIDNVGVTQYRVIMKNGRTGESTVVGVVPQGVYQGGGSNDPWDGEFSMVLPTVWTDTYYYFKVQAGDAAGNWSSDYGLLGGTSPDGWRVYDGQASGPAVPPSWTATSTLRATNIGTPSVPKVKLQWSTPIFHPSSPEPWFYSIKASYAPTSPPQDWIDATGPGQVDQYSDGNNNTYFWDASNPNFGNPALPPTFSDGFDAHPQPNKEYLFNIHAYGMMPATPEHHIFTDNVGSDGPIVKFNTNWRMTFDGNPGSGRTPALYNTTSRAMYIGFPASTFMWAQSTGTANHQSYGSVVDAPVDPSNAYFAIGSSGNAQYPALPANQSLPSTTIELTNLKTGENVPLPADPDGLGAFNTWPTTNPGTWTAAKGTFYGYKWTATDGSGDTARLEVHLPQLDYGTRYSITFKAPLTAYLNGNDYVYEFTTQADVTAPSTSIAGVADGGMYAAPAAFTLAGTDAGSGVDHTYYTVDGVQSEYVGNPVSITGAGSHTVTYWSVDAAGNIESAHSVTVNVSAGAPTTTLSGVSDGWSTTPVTFSLAVAGDASPFTSHFSLGSGATAAYTAPVTISDEGITTLHYYSVDALNQTEAAHTASIKIDSIAPVTTASGAPASGTAYVPVSVALAADDGAHGSGVASTRYTVDGGSAQTYAAPIAVTAPGSHTITYWSVDVAGNTETSHSLAFAIAVDTTAPKAISGLKAAANVDSGVTLSWLAPADNLGKAPILGVAAYDIRYSTTPITAANFGSATAWSGSLTPGAAGSAQSCQITGLTRGTLYYFAIKSSDTVPNWSAISSVASAKPRDLRAPVAITNLHAITAVGVAQDSAAVIGWTTPADDTGLAISAYELRYTNGDVNGTPDAATFAAWTKASSPKPLAVGAAASAVITKLSRGTTYHFAIRAKDAAGNWSLVSNVANVVPIDLAPPKAVSLKATADIDSGVTLRWLAPADDLGKSTTAGAASYKVYYSTSPITATSLGTLWSGSDALVPGAAGTAQSCQITGLVRGTVYYFAVKSADAAGNPSALSGVPTAKPRDLIAPVAISSLSAITPVGLAQDSAAVIGWTTPADDTGLAVAAYEIRYTGGSLSGPVDAATFATWTKLTAPKPLAVGAAATLVVPKLTRGVTYHFAIRSKDAVGNWSAVSNVVDAVPVDLAPPKAITNLKAVAGVHGATISWAAPAEDMGKSPLVHGAAYDIRYSTAPITADNFGSATQLTTSLVPAVSPLVQSASLTGLTAGQKYYFAIKTRDASNWSAISNVAFTVSK